LVLDRLFMQLTQASIFVPAG